MFFYHNERLILLKKEGSLKKSKCYIPRELENIFVLRLDDDLFSFFQIKEEENKEILIKYH